MHVGITRNVEVPLDPCLQLRLRSSLGAWHGFFPAQSDDGFDGAHV